MRKLVVLVLVGCGRVPAPVPTFEPPRIESPVYDAPPPVPAPGWEVTCVGATPKRRVYWDFSSEPLDPVSWGPRVANRSRATPSRSSLQLDAALERRSFDITQCWKWASARGAVATRVELAVTVDPFGRTSDLSLVTTTPSADLDGCLAEVLRDLTVRGVASHTSRMQATLDFARASQPPFPEPPLRPVITDPPVPTRACTAVLKDAPIDSIPAAASRVVSDADPTRLDPKAPAVWLQRCGYMHDSRVDKKHVRAGFASNLGAFRRCHVDARARDSALGGTVVVHAVFEPGGLPTQVKVDGDGDPKFHDCMASATRDLWLDDVDYTIEVYFPFALEPAPAFYPTKLDALLTWGDSDTALAIAAFDIRTARDVIAACRGRADVVRALAAGAPWRDDPRTLAALRDLVAFVEPMRAADARACLAEASEALRQVVVPGEDLLWSVQGRLEAALPLAPHVPWGSQLQIALAEELIRTPRHADGLARLHALIQHGDPALAADLRARVAQIGARRDLPADSCR